MSRVEEPVPAAVAHHVAVEGRQQAQHPSRCRSRRRGRGEVEVLHTVERPGQQLVLEVGQRPTDRPHRQARPRRQVLGQHRAERGDVPPDEADHRRRAARFGRPARLGRHGQPLVQQHVRGLGAGFGPPADQAADAGPQGQMGRALTVHRNRDAPVEQAPGQLGPGQRSTGQDARQGVGDPLEQVRPQTQLLVAAADLRLDHRAEESEQPAQIVSGDHVQRAAHQPRTDHRWWRLHRGDHVVQHDLGGPRPHGQPRRPKVLGLDAGRPQRRRPDVAVGPAGQPLAGHPQAQHLGDLPATVHSATVSRAELRSVVIGPHIRWRWDHSSATGVGERCSTTSP